MSLMQCRTRAALELSRTMRSADDRYYYEMPEFDSVHAECVHIVYTSCVHTTNGLVHIEHMTWLQCVSIVIFALICQFVSI